MVALTYRRGMWPDEVACSECGEMLVDGDRIDVRPAARRIVRHVGCVPEVRVTYMVPVIAVIVDGEVDRVVVIDEEIKLADPVEVTLDDGVTPAGDGLTLHGVTVGESCEWPTWEFGW